MKKERKQLLEVIYDKAVERYTNDIYLEKHSVGINQFDLIVFDLIVVT